MRTIKLGSLYPDLFNLNADIGNLAVVKRRLELSGYKVEVVDVTPGAKGSAELDFLVVGSPSSSVMEMVMSDVSALKPFASELLKSEVVVLAVSNGLHAFGSIVGKDGKRKDSLELLDFTTTYGSKQHVTIAATVETEFGQIAGIENHNATVKLGNSGDRLGEMSFGVGNNTGGDEGYLKNNFFGTHLQGPVLALNEIFADQIVSRVVTRAGGNYEPGVALGKLNALSEEARLHLLKRQS